MGLPAAQRMLEIATLLRWNLPGTSPRCSVSSALPLASSQGWRLTRCLVMH